ncbi:GNAT family N-acetyltransferase [Neisseriaceae bacterium CLB008]|nr:GNAT family N-acetyltransferase [Neisseriaceae bacterium]
MTLTWQTLTFAQLNTLELYTLLRLRVAIFVVEQNCAYPELDGKDTHPDSRHLLGYDADGTLVAYARLLPPGLSYPQPSIGRVAIDHTQRGSGLGHHLIQEALSQTQKAWPAQDIQIGAQLYLQTFYERHGFMAVSGPYLEDDIPHIDMIKPHA